MTVDAGTGLITWTPPAGTTSPVNVTLQATDKAGNSTLKSYAINIVPPNNAPVLVAASPVLGSTNENASILISLASFINNGTGTTITDADTDKPVGGIALINLTGKGTWEYSPDGTTFHTIVSVSASSALLLPKTASLRYTPDSKNAESVSITYRAWDTTAGTPGGRMDLSLPASVGSNKAFSAVTDTATLTVTDVNDAPVLQAAQPSLGSADIHAAKTISLTSFINNSTGTTTITDVDNGAVIGGIAIFGVTGAGTWEYSLDGTTFKAVGTVSSAAALLLPKTAQLRYTPNGTIAESPTISYQAWDTTSGAPDSKVDLSATGAIGGSTAYSALTDIATLSVVDVNDSPVLTPANPTLGTTTEDAAKTISLTGSFINNGTGTTSIDDADATAVKGGIAIIGLTGNGKWEYSLDGTTFTTITGVSTSSALLLPNTATLRYTPDGKNGETATIVYRAWDTTSGTAAGRVNLSAATSYGGITAYSSATDTASLTVTSVNDAPVLATAQPSLGTVAPSAAKTISLTGSFINNGSGSTTITDADTNDAVGGIAIIGFTGAGTWEYSTDGTTFTSLGTISTTQALLLSKNASLRYTATASTDDTPTITYRAWDASTGTNGSKVDLSATGAVGGTTAFSSVTDTAKLTIAGGSIAGFVYLDTNNNGLHTTSSLGIAGVPVRLLSQVQGVWTEVAGKSPVLTAADGSYHFNNLVSGTYRVKVLEPAYYLSGINKAGTVAGAARGTAGKDAGDQQPVIDVQISAGEAGTNYNFAEIGMKPKMISMRMSLASSPTTQQYINLSNTAPVIDLSSSTGNGYTASYTSSGSTVAIAAPDAICTDADSPMLGSMTVTLANPLDGNSEILSANVAGTALTANYSGGVLTLTGAAEYSVYQKVLKTLNYKDTATSPQSGDRTINIVLNDGASNSMTAVATVSVSAAPTGYTITANDSAVNAAEAASTGFTFANAGVGTTYSYTVTSSGGSGSVTGTGTVTSATQQVTGINVASLPNGTLTYSVKLTNTAGISGSSTTATATLDKTAPTGYSITAIDSSINAAKAASTGFTFAGAEIGATFSYTITSSGGSVSVTGNGTISSATQAVTGINVTSLPNGTLTYSVVLTDPAGNAGTATTATAALDKSA
jgi:hypothetical protein